MPTTEQTTMNQHETQSEYSNRPASRRLHRRLAFCVASPCVSAEKLPSQASSILVSLPKTIVREAGMYELLAAELRISELEQALAEAREAACTDPLTGALNRRGFDKACQREQARSRRSGTRLALAHIDIDDFKQLNDALGHQAGDKVLVHLVQVLQRSMRPSDVLCRFGGEEFVLMLPVSAIDEATAAVSRFLREFSEQAVPGTGLAVTFSAGVTLQDLDESLEQAIERADAATYAAKRSGKNCVVSR
jgi:diguanylate cyclase